MRGSNAVENRAVTHDLAAGELPGAGSHPSYDGASIALTPMSVWLLILSLPPVCLAGLLTAHLFRRPRVMRDPAGPALILAAHPDDCVILAGAYALEARDAGQRVQVTYLTCGAAAPHLERAVTRKAEALAAWATIGLTPQDVTFLDLPEHPVDGVSSWSDGDRAGSRARIATLLRELAPRAAVFIPAAGEAHVDHRGLRQIALEAWRDAARGDLTFFEGPEYNAYLSVVQAPKKVWVALSRSVPGLARLVGHRQEAWTGFASGGRYWTLPASEARSERRRSLLRAFVSENGDLLVRLFGLYERYRPVADPDRGLADEPPRGYVTVGGRRRGFSALLVLLVLAELTVVAAAAVVRLGANVVGRPSSWTRAGVVAVVLIAFVLGARRRVAVDARIVYWACAAGALIGGLQ